jgi:subtilisin family serine protease
VIAVGAVDSNKNLAGFSSIGPELEVVAPGVGVNSTGMIMDNPYYPASGTSMATPHVSGALALILSYKPTLTNIEAREILRNTAEDLGDPGWDEMFGFGLINISQAIISIDQHSSNATTTPQVTTNPTDSTITPSDIITSATTTLVTPSWSIIFTSFCLVIILLFRKGKIKFL